MPASASLATTMNGIEVSPLQRMSAVLFGSPSARRANGGFKTRFFNIGRRQKGRIGTRKSKDVSGCSGSGCEDGTSTVTLENDVFYLDEQYSGATEILPRIWISERSTDARSASGKASSREGREYVCVYPNGEDEGGLRALELAERMLGEGFGSNEIPPQRRCLYFQAAEILLLHSVDRGNVSAAVKLGDIYRFDLCKGSYWKTRAELRAKHAQTLTSVDLCKRAWVMYSIGARSKDADAYMKLGDIEVESDDQSCFCNAYKRYIRSYEIMLGDVGKKHALCSAPHCEEDLPDLDISERRSFGMVLFRLASCYERGIGCKRDVSVALALYEYSKMNLRYAFENGSWHSKAECIGAEKGARRCRQEMSLCRDEDE